MQVERPTPDPARHGVAWLMLALAAWTVILSIGMYRYWHTLAGTLVVAGTMGLFLLVWGIGMASRRSRKKQP